MRHAVTLLVGSLALTVGCAQTPEQARSAGSGNARVKLAAPADAAPVECGSLDPCNIYLYGAMTSTGCEPVFTVRKFILRAKKGTTVRWTIMNGSEFRFVTEQEDAAMFGIQLVRNAAKVGAGLAFDMPNARSETVYSVESTGAETLNDPNEDLNPAFFAYIVPRTPKSKRCDGADPGIVNLP